MGFCIYFIADLQSWNYYFACTPFSVTSYVYHLFNDMNYNNIIHFYTVY